MRQGTPSKRGRGRSQGGNRRGYTNPMNRSYDSNGPDVKVRGTAMHIYDKYLSLARDATSSGDTIASENYLQHAEHYYRIMAAFNAQQAAGNQQPNGQSSGNQPGNSGNANNATPANTLPGSSGDVQENGTHPAVNGMHSQPSMDTANGFPANDANAPAPSEKNDAGLNGEGSPAAAPESDGRRPRRGPRGPRDGHDGGQDGRRRSNSRPQSDDANDRRGAGGSQPRAPRNIEARNIEDTTITESGDTPNLADGVEKRPDSSVAPITVSPASEAPEPSSEGDNSAGENATIRLRTRSTASPKTSRRARAPKSQDAGDTTPDDAAKEASENNTPAPATESAEKPPRLLRQRAVRTRTAKSQKQVTDALPGAADSTETPVRRRRTRSPVGRNFTVTEVENAQGSSGDAETTDAESQNTAKAEV